MISEKEHRFKINAKLSLRVFSSLSLTKTLPNYLSKNEDYREVFGLKMKRNSHSNKIYFHKTGIHVGPFSKIRVSASSLTSPQPLLPCQLLIRPAFKDGQQ